MNNYDRPSLAKHIAGASTQPGLPSFPIPGYCIFLANLKERDQHLPAAIRSVKVRMPDRYQKFQAHVLITGIKSLYDWNEWQANALAAAIIMPKKYIELLLRNRRLTLYGKRLNRPDRLLLANICDRLKVSRTAMTLRLKQLGYATVLPADAYYDPTDIECDNDYFLISTPNIGGHGCA